MCVRFSLGTFDFGYDKGLCHCHVERLQLPRLSAGQFCWPDRHCLHLQHSPLQLGDRDTQQQLRADPYRIAQSRDHRRCHGDHQRHHRSSGVNVTRRLLMLADLFYLAPIAGRSLLSIIALLRV